MRRIGAAAAFGLAATLSSMLSIAQGREGASPSQAAVQRHVDPSGLLETLSTSGRIDPNNAFFQSLGTNGRSCSTCHVASQAFGLSAASARQRFDATRGRDPLFAPVDGANCPTGRRNVRSDHSLLVDNGLLRIALPLPQGAEFTVSVVHDPYGCAITPDPATGQPTISVYRRPLPAANLGFLSAVMWDGRETVAPLGSGNTFTASLVTDLTHQALDATMGHAQAAQPPSDAQLSQIVSFELSLVAAQGRDWFAGSLSADGGGGGAMRLADEPYYPGINDALGGDPTGQAFDPSAMTLFSGWAGGPHGAPSPAEGIRNAARRAIAAGEQIFDTAPLAITGVRGLNDNPALGKPSVVMGHCSTCHDAPNVGDHSLALPLDVGTAHAATGGLESDPDLAKALAGLSMPDLPLYRIDGCPDPFDSGATAPYYTSDPGKALLTGKCRDLGLLKGPILRGLAARAPYFHNGAAANLMEVVSFYDQRFKMNLTPEQKRDLVAFLSSL